MSDDKQAAPVDSLDDFVNGVPDQDSEQNINESTLAESATAETDANNSDSTDAEKPKEDGFQKRIDKKTADFYAEKRRADDLQKKIDTLELANKKATLVKPSLEDHDYDEEAFDKADRQYSIDQGVQEALAKQSADAKAEQQKTESEKVVVNFNERANAMGKSDFDAKAQAIPELPCGVADALMQSEDGAEMVYYLGSNPEEAELLASMTPAMAIMQLGKLSSKLSAKPEIKTSAAPDPITPLSSGGSSLEVNEDDMSMAQWMAKNG